jgi:hypothetical protein
MPESTSLINLGELAKPATVLIEKISGAVGEIFKPYQIGRIAQAEARAEIVRAEAQVVISDIQRRAIKRFVVEEERKQKNMEDITAKAIPELGENAKPEAMDDDWVANFYDRCRNISDAEMHKIWASLLAKEAQTSGSVSRRTVNILASMDRRDAELFNSLSKFVWHIAGTLPTPLIFEADNLIYTDAGINFTTLSELDGIGLLRFEGVGGFTRRGLPKRLPMSYYNKMVFLDFPSDQHEVSFGKVMLTNAGTDLLKACPATPYDAFFHYTLDRWRKAKITVSEPLTIIAKPETVNP